MCKACFDRTKTINRPTLEKLKQRGICITCGGEWVGIHVGYYHPDNKYYEVRRKKEHTENRLCHFSRTEICEQGERCRYAHNRLELEVWIEQEKMFTEMKRPSSEKIRCVICKVEFRDVPNLETHLESRDHVARTKVMKILPEVGSSLQYKGPIRARPKVPFSKDTYELCRSFMKHGRCEDSTECKHAHTDEELKVWMEAQIAEKEVIERREPHISSSYASQSFSSQSQGGACRYSSSSNRNRDSKRKSEMSSSEPEKIENDSEYYWRVQGEIQFIRIEDVVKNRPNHVEILCNNDLEQTMEEESSKEFKWVFRIKSSKREILHGILLYEDRNMFKLEGVHKGVKEGKYSELNFPYVPNRNCYQLQQEINCATYIDVTLVFKPRIGQHRVYFVIECMDGGLVTREVKVKVKGITFKEAGETVKSETVPIPKKVSSVQDILPVNWELPG